MAKATKALSTESIILPKTVVAEMIEKISSQSVIASLSAARPQVFEDVEHLIFTQDPEAEYVQEGAAKSSAEVKFAPIAGGRHKVQVTVRVNEEVRYADEDGQLQVLDLITDAMGKAIGRAIDYNMLFGVDTLTGDAISALSGKALADTASKVTLAGDHPTLEELDAFPDKVIEAGYVPNGIAFAPLAANELRKMRNETTGARMFPDINMSLEPSNFEGIRSVTSANVAAPLAKSGAGEYEAIIANWNLIRWGFVRNIGLEEILFGDPDGLGDLKRYNQVAYRAEAIYSFACFDPKGFAFMAKNA